MIKASLTSQNSTPIKLILALLLLLTVFDMPYGYYQFLRIAATAGFIFLAYSGFSARYRFTPLVWSLGALLFNPVFKVALGRELWMVFDLAFAVLLAASVFLEEKDWNRSGGK
ncbi:MAG: hypothetical protein IT279_14040 [Ignavibacteriaceae bacterium]|nr:hypothetical protein [Ignavibacteriaceae bacterium]